MTAADTSIEHLDFETPGVPCQSRKPCDIPAAFRIKFEHHEHIEDRWWFACPQHAHNPHAECPRKDCGKSLAMVGVQALP